MSATLCEIEEWLDTRNSVPVSGGVTGGHGALPHGEKLTLENLESVVERERASGTS